MRKILFLLILVLLSIVVSANEHEPKSISEIRNYSLSQIASISILIALIGGLISILSPCAWPLIPAFLAFALEERKRLVKAAILFYIGLLIPIAILNFGAVFIGNILITNKDKFIFISGIVLIILGLLNIFDRGFGFRIKNKLGNTWSLILIGAAFSAGFTPCVFPITSGIAFVSASLNSYFYAGLLSIAYVTGQAGIVFLGAIFFERFKVLERNVFQKEIKIFNRKLLLVKIISGLILILFGLMFLIYGGSVLFNTFDPGTMEIVTNVQEFFIGLKINSVIGNSIGGLLLALIGYFVYKRLKN